MNKSFSLEKLMKKTSKFSSKILVFGSACVGKTGVSQPHKIMKMDSQLGMRFTIAFIYMDRLEIMRKIYRKIKKYINTFL